MWARTIRQCIRVIKKKRVNSDLAFRLIASKGGVIAKPVRTLAVAIRNTLGETDSHTSDIGHWFGMTHRRQQHDKQEFEISIQEGKGNYGN